MAAQRPVSGSRKAGTPSEIDPQVKSANPVQVEAGEGHLEQTFLSVGVEHHRQPERDGETTGVSLPASPKKPSSHFSTQSVPFKKPVELMRETRRSASAHSLGVEASPT